MRKTIRLFLLLLVLAGTAVCGECPTMAASKTSVEQPKLKSAKAGLGRITITWKRAKNAYGYVVYRKGAGVKKYKKIAVIRRAETLSYTDTKVKSGRRYTYTVKAVRRVNGKNRFSTYSKEGISAVAKTAAVVLKSAVVKNSSIVIRWKKISGAAGYRVYRKEDKGEYVALTDVMKGSATSFKDRTAGMGHVYTYSVRALIQDGGSLNEGEMDPAGVKAQRTITAPVLHAKAASGRIYLSWTSDSGAEGFQVYRREVASKSKKFTCLATTKSGGRRSYWDTNAVTGKEYEYKILAAVKVGKKWVKGTISSAVSAVCLPDTAVLTGISCGETTDTLYWRSVAGAGGYTVYRKSAATDNKWSAAVSLSAGKTQVTLARAEGQTSYAVRAWVKVKKKKLLSPVWFSMSNEEKKYTQQKVLFMGDSITWGRQAEAGARAAVPFPERVSQLTGISYVNAGISGCTMTRLPSGDTKSVIARLEKGIVNYADYSVIVLEIGTNDYNRDIELGTSADGTDTTFCGALRLWFDGVRKQNPDAEILVILPLYRQNRQGDYNYAGWDVKNESGYTLAQYSEALRKAAAKAGAKVWDARAEGVLTEKDGYLLCDGLHPTKEGYLKLGDAVAAALRPLMQVDLPIQGVDEAMS